MTLGHNRTFYAKPIELERFAASGQHADVILVTKENLHISAHKELNLISAKLIFIKFHAQLDLKVFIIFRPRRWNIRYFFEK